MKVIKKIGIEAINCLWFVAWCIYVIPMTCIWRLHGHSFDELYEYY